MNPRTNPVVIAGAGPAGLIAAVLLVRAGQRVLALEKNGGLAKHDSRHQATCRIRPGMYQGRHRLKDSGPRK
jgi:2-polyprenyl-6-methoxyphenol hydroxylase-like FAD-dependent oxidoreductase